MSNPMESAPRSRSFTWSLIARLIRFHSQTGTWLLLLPTLWALVLASGGIPPWHLTLIFTLGSFVMRSAGVVLNDLADRSFDRHVARTKQRPLASGELTIGQAWAVVAGLLALAIVLVSLLNRLTIFLSPIAVALAGLYPFAKRFVHVPQAMLGIAFGWGTIMAWTATHDALDVTAWLLFTATVFWAIGYDTIYAIQDMEDDRRIGVKSSALLFGSSLWLAVGVSLTATLGLLAVVGMHAGIGWAFYGILLLVGLFCLRQVIRLKRHVSPAQAFEMFRQHVGVGTAVLVGLILGFLP